jgi:integrase
MARRTGGAAMSKPKTMVRRVNEYLAYRRSLGFTLRTHGYILLSFARFVDRLRHRGPITPKPVMRWLQSASTSPTYAAMKLSAVVCLARHLAIEDGRSQAPDPRTIAPRGRRKRPHIFTAIQLQELLDATDQIDFLDELGPVTYRTLFGLLASTGLRISEAVNLRRKHVDLAGGVLRVERTKFGKSRLVPLHPTVACALRDFLAARDKQWAEHAEQHVFLGAYKQPLSIDSAQTRFRQVRDLLGWHVGNGELPKPRLHDLRHTFACRCIERWYQEGRDIHQHINALSIYMGHVNVSSTYWYLTASPQLLKVAGHRFEQFVAAGQRRSS